MGDAIDPKKMGCVGVLMGGVSSEREVSLKGGAAIFESLQRSGVNVVSLDINTEDKQKVAQLIRNSNIDIAFIALHGRFGEDGQIQAILDKLEIPYAGSGVEASQKAIDKSIAQNLFKKNFINIPPYVSVSKGVKREYLKTLEKVDFYPVVVKPAREGSSIGITIARDKMEAERALAEAFTYGDCALIEKRIDGREFTVGIFADKPLPVLEIRPKTGYFDYKAKYSKGLTDYIVPAPLADRIAQKMQESSLKAYKVLGCKDFARVDLMLDNASNVFILEVNTIPGFTATSLLPKAAAAVGIDFDQLCLKIIHLAYGKKEKIRL